VHVVIVPATLARPVLVVIIATTAAAMIVVASLVVLGRVGVIRRGVLARSVGTGILRDVVCASRCLEHVDDIRDAVLRGRCVSWASEDAEGDDQHRCGGHGEYRPEQAAVPPNLVA
jgi:hypothetical protein